MAQSGAGWTGVPRHCRIDPLPVREPSGLLESQVMSARRPESRIAHQRSIPIARPQLGPEEESAVLEVMRAGVLTQGERTRAFEQELAKSMGATHGVATCNGSVARYLARLADGIGPGDEVISSPLTFIATANAIAHTGAVPVFADVDDTLNLDCSAAEQLISPRTKAIVLVHLHGNPANVESFAGLTQEHGLTLIQDACQAVGATVDGPPLGAFGTAVSSFSPPQTITTANARIRIPNDP